IFNVYGERMRIKDGRAVPNFIAQALRGKPITVYGSGRQTRSLCYISDMVRGIDKLLHSKINTPINIGNPEEITILQLAKLIKRLTRSQSAIHHKALPIDDPKRRCPDIRQARARLAWNAEVPLEDGLRRTIAYFRTAR
ncbi:MAG TPA: NAD-dependent epimerase/dehydratase family protein, partial [Nitrospirales bacterium]|nr:NAD-dependent epimerase/dehydratase family protein [Nitrospirales bacterium]